MALAADIKTWRSRGEHETLILGGRGGTPSACAAQDGDTECRDNNDSEATAHAARIAAVVRAI